MSEYVNGFEVEQWNVHGFRLKNRVTGHFHTTCALCSVDRKPEHRKDECATIWMDSAYFFCNHCGQQGPLHTYKKKNNIVYKRPEWKNKTDLSNNIVKYFEKRGISQKTLVFAKVTEGIEWMPQKKKEVPVIEFNYFRNNELVNVKYRTEDKDFKLFKDAELIPCNIDAIEHCDECYIVEGEPDMLSFMEIGVNNVVSVPNGATLGAINLNYFNSCIGHFLTKKRIYICVDNDEAGRNLRKQLADRFGYDKCVYIEFPDCKDANEFLVKHGPFEMKDALKNFKEFPFQGVFTTNDIYSDIQDMYLYGLDKGVSPKISGFDLNFVKGYITTITGIPSHGKSQFLDFITLSLLRNHNWKGAFYSPENRPLQLHFSKQARILLGKSWFGNDNERITEVEVANVVAYLNDSFWYIKPEKDFGLDSILRDVRMTKERKGIDFFVIDAWNKLEHKRTSQQSETEYIGECLDKIGIFCEENQLHCFLVAHPTKIKKQKDSDLYEIPTLYDISGSANFYNKTDNGICVYRDFKNGKTIVNVQKVKFDHWGSVSQSVFEYDTHSGRYFNNPITKDNSVWIKLYSREELGLPPKQEETPIQPEIFEDSIRTDVPF